MNKVTTGLSSDDSRQRGFTATRRAPEDHGKNPVFFDGKANQALGADRLLLPHKIPEAFGSHSVSQRAFGFSRFLGLIFEKIQWFWPPLLGSGFINNIKSFIRRNI